MSATSDAPALLPMCKALRTFEIEQSFPFMTRRLWLRSIKLRRRDDASVAGVGKPNDIQQITIGRMTMQLAAMFFTLAVLGGTVMVMIRMQGVPHPPTWLAMGHGLLGATGIASLGYAATSSTIPALAKLSLGLFFVAALGGVLLFVLFHRRGKALPLPLMLGHGALASVALILLFAAIWTER